MKTGGLEALEGREFLGEYICDITVKPDAAVENPRTHMTFGYATQVVILDEDGRLGKVVAAHDVGRAINPLTCAGQIEGAVHMGLGYALTEDLPCTDGVPDSTLLKDIGMLRAVATPEIEVILLEVPDETGGYGSKGVGEIGLVPTAGAVAGALYAFDGIRRYSLPMIESSAAKGLVPRSRRSALPLSLHPLPFASLVRRLRDEVKTNGALFDLPVSKWYRPNPEFDLSATHFGEKAATPLGPAAGPHTQLAPNIVLSWLGGSRIMELKTVQVNDDLTIPRPCIHAPNVGLNVEWSQELRVEESTREYAKAMYLLEILKSTRAFGEFETDYGFETLFDISVGYDLAGLQSSKVRGFLEAMRQPEAIFDELRSQLTGSLVPFRDLELPSFLSHCVTLSTFHGCPPEEIEAMAVFLMEEYGFHTIIKMNPTLLGFDPVRSLLHDDLGYEEYRLDRASFENDLQYPEALAMMARLQAWGIASASVLGQNSPTPWWWRTIRPFSPTHNDSSMYLRDPRSTLSP